MTGKEEILRALRNLALDRSAVDLMREETARAMDIDPSRVNVKATTEEKLGFTGCGDGIAAHAVCLLRE